MPALYFLSLQRDLILSTYAAYTGRSSPVSKAPKHGACVGDWTGAPPTGLQSQHVFCFSPRVRTPPPPLLYAIPGLVGQELDAQDPLGREPVTFSLFRTSHRPWNTCLTCR